jgi:hypothetical protein
MKRTYLFPALLVTLVCVMLPLLSRAVAEPPHKSDLTRQETDSGKPELVSFPSGDLVLRGFLYKPDGVARSRQSSGITVARNSRANNPSSPGFIRNWASSSSCLTVMAKVSLPVTTFKT